MKASNYLAVEHDDPNNNGTTTTTSKQRFVLRRLSSRSSSIIQLKIPGRKPRRPSSKKQQQSTQQRQQQKQQQRHVVFEDNVTVRIVPSMLDLLLQNETTSSSSARFYQSKLWYQSEEYTAMKSNIQWLVRGLQQGHIQQADAYCLRGLEKQLGITNIVDQQPVRVRPEHDFSISSSAARPVVQHVLREQARQGSLAVILASSASTTRRGKRQRRNSSHTSTTTKGNNNNNDIDVVRLSKISRMITAKDTDEAIKRGRIDEQVVVVAAAAVRSRSHMVSI